MTQGSERMYEYIRKGKFDTVICTHVFTALMLTDMLKKHPMNVATCFVSTDYTCSPSTKESNLNFYFIPDADLMPDFECENITENKMISCGIPVRQMFYTTLNKEQAKISAGIKPDHLHLLMMCGSMGCGPMKTLLKRISGKIPDNWDITVICGNNQKLEEKLSGKYINKANVHIRGFVKDMGTMMDSGDLYLTKPGGISVTEASVKNLPMILIDAVAGCEEYNRIHFIRKGGAKTGANTAELTDLCLKLMNDDEKRKKLHDAMANSEKQNSAEIIYKKMKETAVANTYGAN